MCVFVGEAEGEGGAKCDLAGHNGRAGSVMLAVVRRATLRSASSAATGTLPLVARRSATTSPSAP